PTLRARADRGRRGDATGLREKSCGGNPLPRVEGMPRSPFFEEFRKLGISAWPDCHLQGDVLVAGVSGALNAFAAQPQLRAGIRALRTGHRHWAGDCRHRYSRPKHRLDEADRQLDLDIVTIAAEQRVRRDMHLDQRVAGGPAAKTRSALAAP